MTWYRVLVIDDLAAVRRSIERVLHRAGHTVLTASNGEEACEVIRGTPVDVILMDLRMPSMSGETLFQLILSEWPDLAQRLAVMSGDPEAEDHAAWLALHNLPVLYKPFNLNEMTQVVMELGSRTDRPAQDNHA